MKTDEWVVWTFELIGFCLALGFCGFYFSSCGNTPTYEIVRNKACATGDRNCYTFKEKENEDSENFSSSFTR